MDIVYQKYRPTKISHLDLKTVRNLLAKVLSSENLPHAFLFAGPKGIGKTSAARVLAKSLNCLKQKKGEPCGKCDLCLEIGRGESLDVLEIDAASNRGIDDIRLLKEKVNLQPLKAKSKVYIVDEVHMLTREAFNAILKTLEEPPAHVYFVFCTTNPEKIPETVLSRLTRIDFQQATQEEIIHSLGRVVKGEKLKIDKEILELIAGCADGSFRDAHKIFYQLWLENKGRISLKSAQKALASWQEATPWYLLELIANKQIKEAVVIFETLGGRGVDWQDYGRRLLVNIQKLLLVKLGAQKGEKKTIELTNSLSLEEIIALGNVFGESLLKAKGSPLPWLPFQLAVISLGKYEEEKKEKPFPGELKTKKLKQPVEKKELVVEKQPVVKKQILALESLKENWLRFLEAVKPLNHSVCALLRAARPKKVDQDYVTLEVFYQFHKEQLEQERNRKILEQALASLFQTPLRIRCELGEKPVSVATAPKPISGNGDDLYKLAKDIFGE
ncbi:DNA polymerase III subunit gamma/tau [Candidatus Shapirobacteria bacterium]|nr:DNA polymerase III subunit gamma/tau [Candidatus Shapirobacteria bacterium]